MEWRSILRIDRLELLVGYSVFGRYREADGRLYMGNSLGSDCIHDFMTWTISISDVNQTCCSTVVLLW
jgi:hypothetical protein